MSLLDDLADVGRAPGGGYARHGFDRAEAEMRDWFREQAGRRGLDVETDRNGNLWAWWGTPGPDALVTGSHLDSVPGGGAFDGPLGVISALEAVSRMDRPARPFAVIVFTEEEGGRFGVPCLGSRLLTGALAPDRARALRDADGVTLAEAAASAGVDPVHIGRDEEALSRIGTFVELHVEQGRGLDVPVGVGSTVIEHGRWRFSFMGEGNHAGTTVLGDRHDPMLPAAETVLATRRIASTVDARATVGRLVPHPGGTNVIPSTVDLWLDARGHSRDVVAELTGVAERAAAAEGCTLTVTEESYSGTVTFDPTLRDRLTDLLGAPELPTGAGHDAAVLAAHAPTAMLYVRNPTGISHAPEEFAEDTDIEAGVVALTRVLESLSR
ncbi:allantoate amidohydrolase [Amycolatopsis endophytica]|uniref:N-carbamoyl-L-amino-acid hydrolase n=1 Tax=Amycolatopsis endophytica TaxID=860233 RepID=A0A853AXG3_9PSEU|nr:allantoate amidohydrolase [Amycolatopsis endophytica]NYI87315.1 N-carbamoyl-L-amino-acid hydrolase [Amycolatopsis endophytica]